MNNKNKKEKEKLFSFLKYFEDTYKKYILGYIEDKPKEPIFKKFNNFNKETIVILNKKNIKLYKHQTLALENLYNNKNVIVTTSTSSGKSMIFITYIIDQLIRNPKNTFLIIYPTRALLYDQLNKLETFIKDLNEQTKRNIKIKIFLGDISYSEKKKYILEKPNIILTTIDNLHLFILKNNELFADFLKNLNLIVVDEIHIYRSYLGINSAYVFRRLFRILEYKYNNKNYKILGLSATLKNTKDFVKKLFGLDKDFIIISKDYSKKYYKKIYIVDTKDENLLIEDIILNLLKYKIKFLFFIDSKKQVELFLLKFRKKYPDYSKYLFLYKGSLLKEDRREIEYKFKMGTYLGLITTSALELGIDIGDISCVINYGIPSEGTFSILQRIGRAGRSQEGFSIIILDKRAIDLYFKKNYKELLKKIKNKILEDIPLEIENEYILKEHLIYLSNELGYVDKSFLEPKEIDMLEKLYKNKIFYKSKDVLGNEYYKLNKNKVNILYKNLRNIGTSQYYIILDNDYVKNIIKKYRENPYKILYILKHKNFLIEELDKESFYRYALKNMYYYSKGKIYEITDNVSIDNFCFILAKPSPDFKITYPLYEEKISILEIKEYSEYENYILYRGKIEIYKKYIGITIKDNINRSFYTIYYDKPYIDRFISEAVWITIKDGCISRYKKNAKKMIKKRFYILKNKLKLKFNIKNLEDIIEFIDLYNLFSSYKGYAYEYFKNYISQKFGINNELFLTLAKDILDNKYLESPLHAIEHLLIKTASILEIDYKDLGGYSYVFHPNTEKPTIFIYEAFQGGIGWAKKIYKNFDKLLNSSYNIILSCPCLEGCPSCIYSPKCGNFNIFLNKNLAKIFLKTILNNKKKK